jgi:hypothetical protein
MTGTKMISMRPYYKWAVSWPLLFVIGSQLLYCLYELFFHPTVGEWLTDTSVALSAVLLLLLHSAWVAAICLPLLLADRPLVRRYGVLQLLCWFLLPFTWFASLLLRYWHTDSSESHGSDNLLLLANTVPFAIGLLYSFLRFRRDLGERKMQ